MSTAKLTTDDFIKKAKTIHGDKYDYSKVEYINSKTNVCIVCPEHGEFWQRPNNHLMGSICPDCAKIKSLQNRPYKLTREQFIEKAKNVHGSKYDYSKVEYKKSNEKVCIICPEHGEFWQFVSNHLKGCGCPRCSQNKSYTSSEFIEILKNKHDTSNIILDNLHYINNVTPVEVKCKIHGVFYRKPSNLLHSIECPECQKKYLHNKFAKTTEQFISEAIKIHADIYNYSKVEYINANTKVCIICPEHGEFLQTPINHLKGQGCPECAKNKLWENRQDKITTDIFISRSKLVHGDKYDYSKVNYKDIDTKVCIICPEHGEFWQRPYSHMKGGNCSLCSAENTSSVSEEDIAKFIEKYFPITTNDRSTISRGELDIFIPSKNIAIEFDGLYWHNEIKCKSTPSLYHLHKTNKCKEKGIRLIHIFEDEWLNKQEIVKSRLKSILGVIGNKIYARKCVIKEVTFKETKCFLDTNHIQGNVNSKYSFGLYYNDELVSLMTFGPLRKNLGSSTKENNYELLRFCNKLNTNVIGGASKLLKHFIETVNPKEIISYADKRWSDGGLYEKLGFEYIRDSKPNYFYIVKNKRENRFKYRKSELIKQGFDPNKSEHEIMLERKIYRIYDCGTMVFNLKL